ncbi:MAG: ribonuclease P protein component [Bacteroidota bacterium]
MSIGSLNYAIIRYTFSKHGRLSSKKLINALFRHGKTVNFYPIRLVYLSRNRQLVSNTQVMFAAPKRKFKSAVTRNTIKRRMREAYRLHKHLLASPHSSSVRFLLGYIYMGSRQQSNFQVIQEKIIQAIYYLSSLYQQERPV